MAKRTLFLLALVWLFSVAAAAGAASPAHLGVFPLHCAPGSSPFATDALVDSLGHAIVEDLRGAGLGEVEMLAWPPGLDVGDTPNLETLVGIGKTAGCNGVLLLQVRDIAFTAQKLKLPLVGTVALGDVQVGLSGGLIDVATAAGVAPVEVSSKQSQRPLRGPQPEEVLGKPLSDGSLRDSLLLKALDDARAKVRAAIAAGMGCLSAEAPPPPVRASAPEGLGFSQDVFTLTSEPGYDIRGVVAVVNRGTSPESFMLKPTGTLPDIVAGFVGEGSIDKACTLGPGQWKSVRFVANTNRQLSGVGIPLGLYTAPAGEQPNLSSEPNDVATMLLTVQPTRPLLTLTVLKQDPTTQAVTCRLANAGGDIWGCSVRATGEWAGQARFIPNVSDNLFVPGRGAVQFTVVPSFPAGARNMEVPIEAEYGNACAAATLHFAIPDGSSVYDGLAHTESYSGSFEGWCVNQGGSYYQDGGGVESSTGPGYDWANSSWRSNVEHALGGAWYRLAGGGAGLPQHDYSGGDLRGASIRPSVLARVPELAYQDTLYPGIAFGWSAVTTTFLPDPQGSPTVVVAASAPDGLFKSPVLSQLNEEGHSATWPFTRLSPDTPGAYTAWVDAVAGHKANIAVRCSENSSRSDWGPVQYLTTHSSGVDDPVVLARESGYVAVAWQDLRAGAGRVYVRVSHDGGVSFAPETALPCAPGETQSWPQLAAIPDAGMGLVYVSQGGGAQRIVYRALSSDGESLSEPVALSAAGASCGEPQLAYGPQGPVAVWREGDGAASEIWCATRLNGTWGAPKRLTNDKAYSEYPVLRCDGNEVAVSYHSDISGVTDLVYRITSADAGATWGKAAMQPSAQCEVEQAWLEVSFHLQNARDGYPPFNTEFIVNGTTVASIDNAILEGTYLFEVPASLVHGAMGALFGNRIQVKVETPMDAHFIYAGEERLIATWRYTQVPVVADSQEAADRLAPTAGIDRNHSQPDLVLAANALPRIPGHPSPGSKLDMAFVVRNIGERPATAARIVLYAGDPTRAATPPAKVAERALGTINPGALADATVTVSFDPAKTPRIYAVVTSAEVDFYPDDNQCALSFAAGASGRPSPLLGTDLPNLFYTPGLLGAVKVVDMLGYANLLSLPNVAELVSLPSLGLPDVKGFANSITSWLGPLSDLIPARWLNSLLH